MPCPKLNCLAFVTYVLLAWRAQVVEKLQQLLQNSLVYRAGTWVRGNQKLPLSLSLVIIAITIRH
jgi:hypothetical protein